MKKFVFASMLALAATTASAVEVGVTASREFGPGARDAAGVTVGQSFDKLSITAGFDRFTRGGDDQNRFSLVAGYDVFKLGPATVSAKAGGAYLDNQYAESGYAGLVGAGVKLPLTKEVSLGVDVARQYGQERVKAFNGNVVTAGLKYSF
jgi:hypothetical protein